MIVSIETSNLSISRDFVGFHLVIPVHSSTSKAFFQMNLHVFFQAATGCHVTGKPQFDSSTDHLGHHEDCLCLG